MAEKDEINKIILREKERKLFINRVPRKTREEFVEFAEEEFADDYGAALKYVWDMFKLWKNFFENIDYKLSHIINLLENKDKEKELNLLSGKKIKLKEAK